MGLPTVKDLIEELDNAWIVGGAVRDTIMGNEIHDIDIVTATHPDIVTQMYASTYPVGEKFGTIGVETSDWGYVEVTTMRKDIGTGRHPEVEYTDNIDEDAARRDFRCNCIYAKDLKDRDTWYDPYDGISDIKAGILRTVGNAEQRMFEDPLRVFRAARFYAKYWMEPTNSVRKSLKKADIKDISMERIRDEFFKMLVANPQRAVSKLIECEKFQIILPEIYIGVYMEQNPEHHPEGNVLVHSIETAMYGWSHGWTDFEIFTCLIHDVGKPFARISGNHYYGHDALGAPLAENIAYRFKLSKKQREALVFVVENHMRVCNWNELKTSKKIKLAESEHFELLCKIHEADCRYRPDRCYAKPMRDFEFDIGPKIEPLLSGKDLIETGFKPGPIFNKILTEMVALQVEGLIVTREDAFEWLNKYET